MGLRTYRAHVTLLSASALLLMLVFPPVGWGWLAHVALVPAAALALRSEAPRRLLLAAWAVSWLWWCIMIAWMWPVTSGGMILLAAFMAIYLPLTLWSFRLLERRYRLPAVLALPMTWVTFELIRGYFLQGGFGWLALSHSQAPYLPHHGTGRIIQIADLFGEHGVSFLVAMSNGLILDLLARPLVVPTATGRPRMNPMIRWSIALWIAAFFGAFMYGQWRINQFDHATRLGPRVAVIQTNVPQDNKERGTAEQVVADWHRLVDLTREAAAHDVELIVWPETVTPVPINREAVAAYQQWGDVRQMVSELARQLNVTLLVGSSTEYFEPYRRYNSAFVFHADGSAAFERYDKIHRVPFGEYTPWVEHWPALKQWFIRYLTPYDFDYTLHPGASWTVFELEGREQSYAVVTPICFEDTVPRVIRRLLHEGGTKRADAIVNLTNDGWFAHSSQPVQHFQIAVFRSIENRVPTARSVNTGVSGFIDSLGRVGPMVQQDGRIQRIDGFAVHTLQLDERQTLFGRIGHIPGLILIGLTAAMVLVALRRRDRMMGRI